MKKISYLFVFLILLTNISSCAGYKPIFGSSNLEFKIADYIITGDSKLGNQIYSRLYNLSKANKNNTGAENIYISINVTKDKRSTAKNTEGKVLGYKINLSTAVTIKNLMTGKIIVNENFSYSSTFKTQDQFSETKKIENRSLESLINKTYQDLLIKISENIWLKQLWARQQN